MLARKLLVETMDLIVLTLQLFDNAVAVPGNFEAEFELAGHLLEHVFERRIDALEHFSDIVVRAEDRAKAHGDDGVILHLRFDHMLMGQGIVTGGVKDKDGSAADHGRDIAIVDGIHVFIDAANAAAAEANGRARFNHAINVPAFLLLPAAGLLSLLYRG